MGSGEEGLVLEHLGAEAESEGWAQVNPNIAPINAIPGVRIKDGCRINDWNNSRSLTEVATVSVAQRTRGRVSDPAQPLRAAHRQKPPALPGDVLLL